MKKILGLDLGTNSIGWALVGESEGQKKIIGMGSRVIPMSQDVMGKFDSGNSVSQTADRTSFRGVRRLRERHLLRRERLHRILHLMGFLPSHFEQSIDFENRLGKFKNDSEPKLAWKEIAPKKLEFIFKDSFAEMICEFKNCQPQLFLGERLIPYDWTIYYLRKKALNQRIEKQELAWILLNFNQKRGYYQLRGEEEDDNPNKLVEYHSLKVVDVLADDLQKGRNEIWYSIKLENGWIYKRSSKIPLFDLKNKVKEFIVTTELNNDGSVKADKEGNEKRSFRAPSEDDWTLMKKKTEFDIEKSHMTVGCYIYDSLLKNPAQKIKGRLIRTIERKFYREELEVILKKQKEFHEELNNKVLLRNCLEELYPNNESHRNTLQNADFTKLFIDDIIFYQRPLKSKKSLISNCPYEFRTFRNESGLPEKVSVKCIPRSHPLFQEFRLWQFIHNLKIYEREGYIDGKLCIDLDVTDQFLKTEEDLIALFEWLSGRKEIKQDTLIASYFKIRRKKGEELLPYRWNYVEEKEYPGNETHHQIINRLAKLVDLPLNFSNRDNELELWHILYSVEDKNELEKALRSFANKKGLGVDFVESFKKFPPFKKEYGSYSAKAIKKLLPLMRMGKFWSEDEIDGQTRKRIDKIIYGEYDENINDRVREKAINLKEVSDFRGLPLWLVCYIVYGRHSESGDLKKWSTPQEIESYLREDFKQHSLRNPIVEQIVTETLRVVKDIWKKFGDLSEIHIELGRAMKNDKKARENISRQISENENTNLRIKALLLELQDHSDIENVRPYSPGQQEILKIYEEGVLSSIKNPPDEITKIARSGQPSKSELLRYKLWLEQKYRSPYTGEIIPLSRLFTSAYEIEHIIPQSRYFDDSLSNKVICEAEVNKEKANHLGYEFIKNNQGRIIELAFGKKAKVFTIIEYEEFVKGHYGGEKTKTKLHKLLMDDIPDKFIERQMNDTRYISKLIKGFLSNVVRDDEELEAISKNVIPCTGAITSELKRDWGLNDVWNRIITPRYERMNLLTNSNNFGSWVEKDGKRFFQPVMPLELQKGFSKKRIDHRHHAMDALVIACATRNHINYLNNEASKSSSTETRYDLRNSLCFKAVNEWDNGYSWQFIKPWETFTNDAHKALDEVVVSFKQNLRVINKNVNRYQGIIGGEKTLIMQTKGENWAIRKPLHKDTVAGLVNPRLRKRVSLGEGIDNVGIIVDKNIKAKIQELITGGNDKKAILKYFRSHDNKLQDLDISRLEVYYFTNDREGDALVASRVPLDESFGSLKIKSITDTGIRQILLRHLARYNEVAVGQIIEHPELAFTPEAIVDMNQNLISLNQGRYHLPIYRVRTFEPKGNKFNVGHRGNKKDKFVEAAKGTNLFFAIYQDEKGNRSFETIPLITVIERLKQGLSEVPQVNDKGENLLFHLSPNDMVYVPTEEQLASGRLSLNEIEKNRIYNFVSSSGLIADFVPNTSASTLFNMNLKDQQKKGLYFGIQNEFGVGSPKSKNERAITGEMIKKICLKLYVDRLGSISF